MPDGPSEIEDRPATALDDFADRDELRRRYYGLMQELRVLLPGVQILMAFLLTAPFSSRFPQLDDTGRVLYALALGTSAFAVVAFATPTVIHRLGDRRARSARLQWSIRSMRAGLAGMALALIVSIMVVARLVFSDPATWVAGGAGALLIVGAWVALPVLVAGRPARQS